MSRENFLRGEDAGYHAKRLHRPYILYTGCDVASALIFEEPAGNAVAHALRWSIPTLTAYVIDSKHAFSKIGNGNYVIARSNLHASSMETQKSCRLTCGFLEEEC